MPFMASMVGQRREDGRREAKQDHTALSDTMKEFRMEPTSFAVLISGCFIQVQGSGTAGARRVCGPSARTRSHDVGDIVAD